MNPGAKQDSENWWSGGEGKGNNNTTTDYQ
jgi:hypothetical protein